MSAARTRPSRQLLLPLAALLLLAGVRPAAADDSQPSVQYLEAQQKAASYRLESLRAAAAEDERLRSVERSALGQIARMEKVQLESKGDFLMLHKAFFAAMVDALLPLTWEQDGFRFAFAKGELELKPEAIYATLSYEVTSPEIKLAEDEKPPQGKLRCRIEIVREGGALSLRTVPLKLEVDDHSYKSARLLQGRFPAERFAGLLPVVPVPVSLPTEVTWEGKRQAIDARLDLAQLLILPEQVVLPFTLQAVGVPQRPPEPATPAAQPTTEPPRIPVGLTPDGVKKK